MAPDFLGITLWSIGILFIITFTYVLGLSNVNSKDNEFKKQFYLILLLMLAFILIRIGLRIYSNNLHSLGLQNEIIVEKLLFIRIFLQVPYAIATTILLIISYSYLMGKNNFKNNTKKA